MKKIFFLFAITIVLAHAGYSQGCIMVRNISGFGQFNLSDNAFITSNWQLNIIGRYFKAFRDFKEGVDQNTPIPDQSIVQSYSTDFTLSRLFSNGWAVDFSFPIASNSRSATKEHGGAGTTRYTTNTFGIGDIRFTVYKWLLKPRVTQKINFQLGLGIKLPTGDCKYMDYFHKNDSLKILAPVNGSIQLGDGGTGVITQLNFFYFLNSKIQGYGNFYYLINPRDQNGVSTTTGRIPTATELKTGNDVYSVPDIYSIRLGLYFTFGNLVLSAGIRDEGVPVHDLVGGSNCLRRPGYNLSADPGVIYKMNQSSIYLYVPFIVSRRIYQSIPDAQTTEITKTYTIGSGGSGNCQVLLGVLFKL